MNQSLTERLQDKLAVMNLTPPHKRIISLTVNWLNSRLLQATRWWRHLQESHRERALGCDHDRHRQLKFTRTDSEHSLKHLEVMATSTPPVLALRSRCHLK